MAKYEYSYDGSKYHYQGYVRDANGKLIWSVNYPEYIATSDEGDIICTETIFEKGYVKTPDDMKGVEAYLKSIGTLNQDDELVFTLESEQYLKSDKKNDFLQSVKDMHEDIAEVTLRDGTKISGEELMGAHKMAKGGGVDNYKDFELNAKGNFASTINGKNYEIIYRDDKSQMYDLFEDGKKIKSSRAVRDVMNFADGGVTGKRDRKADYETYHKTLSSALDEAQKFVNNRGYEFSEDRYFPDLTMGGVSYGQTSSVKREVVEVGGKNRHNTLILVVYRMDSGTYELTMYFARSNWKYGGYMEKGGLTGDVHSITDKLLSQKIQIFLDKVKPFNFYYIDGKTLHVGFGENFTTDQADKFYKEASSSKEFFDADSVNMKFNPESNDTMFSIDLKKEVKYAKGGTTFKEKASSISKSLLKRKKVAPAVQKDYGKTYNKKEAVDSAKRIAGAMRAKEMTKGKSKI
jgi:hypothetical protein